MRPGKDEAQSSSVARLRAFLNLLNLLHLLNIACWHVADVPGVQGELLPAGAWGSAPCRAWGNAPHPLQSANQPINPNPLCVLCVLCVLCDFQIFWQSS